jgi:hypothetical protein
MSNWYIVGNHANYARRGFLHPKSKNKDQLWASIVWFPLVTAMPPNNSNMKRSK